MSSDPPDDAERRETTDHALVRSIVEEHGGYPAHEPGTEGEGDQGLLRIGDRDRGEDLKEISWEAFFEEFEQKDLALYYSEDSDLDEVVLRERSGE